MGKSRQGIHSENTEMVGRMRKFWKARYALYVALAVVACGQSEGTRCGSSVAFQIYEIGPGKDCGDCELVSLSSIVTSKTELVIAKKPFITIDRCEIDRISAFTDAVSLQLTSLAHDRLSTSERLRSFSPEQLLAVRFENSPEIVSLLRARNIGLNIPLLDLDSQQEIDSFIERVGSSAVVSVPEGVVRGTAVDVMSPAAVASKKLLEKEKRDQVYFDELKRLSENGMADSEAFKDILQRLEEAE